MAEKETEFTFYAGPLLTSEELKAAQARELDDEVEFVSPRVPGRMQRGASTPPRREGRGRMSARSQMRLATEEDVPAGLPFREAADRLSGETAVEQRPGADGRASRGRRPARPVP